jgi:poly-gamma-glutamate synthesis protein (capsule biosynthesis protein)
MKRPSRQHPVRVSLILCAIALLPLLNACSALQRPAEGNPNIETNPAQTTFTLTPFQPVKDAQTIAPGSELTIVPTATLLPPSPIPEPTPVPLNPSQSVWIAPFIPADIVDQITLPPGISQVQEPANAMVRLSVGEDVPLARWIYALVAPYPTITDGVTKRDLNQSWQGNPGGPFAGKPILMDGNTYAVFSTWWGEPAQSAVQIIPSEELIETAWDQRSSWGIVPFESLEPGWKVLAVDNQSPLRKNFSASDYALTVPFSFQGDPQLVELLLADNNFPTSNRDPNLLSTVAVTGVTALVRATAFTMHRNGITYPARDIGELLRSADITHISNEIPFTPDCPFPNPVQESLRFCSRPEYIELLEEVGTDIVELTGDHFGDWGPDAMRYTLGMYEDRDWMYYGGGYDRKDARKARLIEHNGNRIAFIGCNGKGGGYATANENQPGAVACDFDWLQQEIGSLVSEGYQVIATFQHFEYYTYYPQPDQVRDFRALAQAGAAVVSGSQAHQPQGMEFHENAFIHYGLGNLFFDQYHFCTDYACDDGFIDLHVFYEGEYIGNELVTIIFEDYARPRPMTPGEREILLNKVFTASDWQ